MNFNDYESVWKRQQSQKGAKPDLLTLIQGFEAKSRKQSGSLFWRDIREAVAGVFLVVYFARMGWQGGKGYWPVAIADLLILGVTGFFVFERIRARRARLGPAAPLLAKLEADLAEMRHQRHLLLNVTKWYLAPLVVSWAIVLATKVANHPEMLQAKSQKIVFAAYLVVSAFAFFGVRALSRWVVRKKTEPRIEELEKLRADLLSSNNQPS